MQTLNELAIWLATQALYIKKSIIDDLQSYETPRVWKPNLPPLPTLIRKQFIKLLASQKTIPRDDFADTLSQVLCYAAFIEKYCQHHRQALYCAQANQDDVQTFVNDHSQVLSVAYHRLTKHLSTTDFTERTWQSSKWPLAHFYESFLHAYQQDKRRSYGVYYTPIDIVDCMVRSVHEQLIKHFQLPLGLADTTRWKDIAQLEKVEVPRHLQNECFVRILDPAAGTGVFLVSCIRKIRETLRQEWHQLTPQERTKKWSNYLLGRGVYQGVGLLQRIISLEVLQAPHTIAACHMLIHLADDSDMPFYLPPACDLSMHTQNALHEAFVWHPTGTSTATPATVIIGNPPYRGESRNQHPWIMHLLKDYKREPNSPDRLNERNLKWLNDDYVKFIRFGQYHIENAGLGIVCFVNPHGFLDNPTFRGMRWSLLNQFDSINIIDLHGNVKRKEHDQDGSRDENVFDIQQGISIQCFRKSNYCGAIAEAPSLAQVTLLDLYGKRTKKLATLQQLTFEDFARQKILPLPPSYELKQQNNRYRQEYLQGVPLDEIFMTHSVGIVTSRDKFIIQSDKSALRDHLHDFFTLDSKALKDKYSLRENKRWQIQSIQKNAQLIEPDCILPISYRPFDCRWVYYHDLFVERTRKKVMQHLQTVDNIGLAVCRQIKSAGSYHHAFVHQWMMESSLISNRTGEIGYSMPLYTYDHQKNQHSNIAAGYIDTIQTKINSQQKPTSQDIFDYIYALLHHKAYLQKFFHQLKKSLPRIPYPHSKENFLSLVTLGTALRKAHLLQLTHSNPHFVLQGRGDNRITNSFRNKGRMFQSTTNDALGQIWINDQQFFTDVPKTTWEAQIGAYKPAQKWLFDRRILARPLTSDEVYHYRKILWALSESNKLQQQLSALSW